MYMYIQFRKSDFIVGCRNVKFYLSLSVRLVLLKFIDNVVLNITLYGFTLDTFCIDSGESLSTKIVFFYVK